MSLGGHLPSLHHNGAVDPSNWRTDRDNLREPWGCPRPQPGDLVAWRYAAWLVHEIRPYNDVDVTAEQQVKWDESVQHVSGERRAIVHAEHRPFHIVLRHHTGPLIIKPGEARGFTRLHDGGREVSFTSWPHEIRWNRLTDPYRVCSCHGYPWPCQEQDQAVMAAHHARKMDRLMATAEPGVCAHCLEPVSTRQRALTFPEESRWVPGAPGPTFHAGRRDCWRAAEDYERAGRLTDDPTVTRLASCPGIRFLHETRALPLDQRLECTAGPACTGLHGPAGYQRDHPCWEQITWADNEGAYFRPGFDCGYRWSDRVCLGGDLSSGGGPSAAAADVLWEQQAQACRRSRGDT